MHLNDEQLKKLIDLSEIGIDYAVAGPDDISKALIAIERKLLSFSAADTALKPMDFNILIVDDLELSIYQFNQMLKRIGIVPTVARTKEEAFAELKKKKFDYIVVDLFLPDAIDGIELIQECLKLKDENHLNKIIVMSGTDDKSLIEKCYKLGIDEFVPKSANWHEQILKFITSSISNKQHNDFLKYFINETIVCYTLNKFNTPKSIEGLVKDVTTTVYTGYKNIIFNMENIKIFDDDYTGVFADLFRLAQENGGSFTLVNISNSLRTALADAFLDTLIPIMQNVDAAVSKLSANS
ncbi:TPA: response regulator [Candidatus Spyradomonas excrementavium]|nr:response regulator [Candidatus Spyradomonas excrementavium]